MTPNPKQTFFQEEWLRDPSLRDVILRNPKDKTSAICSLCDNKIINLSNMGKRAILSHIDGKRHQNRISAKTSSHDITLFASSKTARGENTSRLKDNTVTNLDDPADEKERTSKDNNDRAESSFSSLRVSAQQDECPEKFRGLQKYILPDEVTTAEIMWTLFTVENHLSLRAAGKGYKIFRKMFLGCEVADKMQLGRTKISYNIVHGLAPYFHDLLVKEIIDGCDEFVVSYDESLNKFSQMQQLDIAVKFWSKSKDEVTSRYFTSAFIGHSTAANLLEALLRNPKTLDLKKLLEVSMDGPYVNLRLIKDLETHLLSTNDPGDPLFVFMGTCGLHVVNNAFKTAFSDKLTGWIVIAYLRAVYNLFKDVPAHRIDLLKYSGSSLLPLKFCPIRWLNNSSVAIRGKDLLPNLGKFKDGIDKDPKHGGIKTYSYDVVAKALNDKLMAAKLAFFSSVAEDLEPFLTQFQSNDPMAPFLFTELNSMLTNLIKQLVKSEEVAECKTVTKIDLTDSKVLIPAKNFCLPFSVKVEIRKVKVTDKDILVFKSDCMTILKQICVKLIEKSPLKYRLCKGITFCDPALLRDDTYVCVSRLETTLSVFEEKNWIGGSQCDLVLREFKKLCSKPVVKESFKNYDKTKERLDIFWRTLYALHGFSDQLWGVLKKVLILSQGNAFVERGFSINKELIVENQLNESLIAQRQVYDGLQVAGGLDNVGDIPKAMILKVRNARSLYEETLQGKKKEKMNKGLEEVNKKRLVDEVQELKKKKLKLLSESQREVEKLISNYWNYVVQSCHEYLQRFFASYWYENFPY